MTSLSSIHIYYSVKLTYRLSMSVLRPISTSWLISTMLSSSASYSPVSAPCRTLQVFMNFKIQSRMLV